MNKFYYHPHAGYDKDGNWITGNEWVGTDDIKTAELKGTFVISAWEYEHIFGKENRK